ncbi:hypothetical protein YQE_11649, partial [Dendroctonus ponderosae]
MFEEVLAVLKRVDAVCLDVDSTVIREEGIDELAKFCGKGDEVAALTAQAMSGAMSFEQALHWRLNIIRPSVTQVKDFIKTSPLTLTPGVKSFVDLLHNRIIPVFLVSGGFSSIIAPIAEQLKIPMTQVAANRLMFFLDGEYAGFDESQPTSRSGGKGVFIEQLKETCGFKHLVLIGDGMTDVEACPPADAFIGYGGNIIRPEVRAKAKCLKMDNHPNILHGAPLERLLETSLGELLLMVLKVYEDNILLVDSVTNEELSARTILARSIQLAKWLKSQNIGIGDSVSVNSENRGEFAITAVATFLIAATFAPLNPGYTPAELKHVLNLSKPKLIFCSEETIEKMLKFKATEPSIRQLVVYGNTKPPNTDVVIFEDILQGVSTVDESFKSPEIDLKETVATILCSSGTTGLPKGVMCTQDNMSTYVDVGRIQLADLALNDDPSDAMLGLTPFFHSMGFMLMFLNLVRGKKMVIIRKFQLKSFLDTVVKYRIRRLIVPPPVLILLLKNPLVKQYDLTGLKEVRSGAAPLGKGMENELKQRFKVGMVSQSYGMTETTLGVLMAMGDNKLGSVGKIVTGMMVKVIDESGEPLGPNQEGELCFKGPLIMKGYVGDPKATAETIDKDGWLHTGDVGYYDEDKQFFIVDRLKELIKYKAFQVAPAELEALLMTHPSIADAAVVGLPDEDAGELPLAYVVKRPGKEVSEEEVKKFVADTLSHQKQLRGGVFFIKEIPRNPTGKILRRVLRDRAKNLVKIKSKL